MAGLASFGAKGRFIGKVRDDALGQNFAEDLRTIGVQFDTAMAESGPPTACSIIAVTPDGHRSMNTYLGACRELTPDDIDASEIGNTNILYIEGYLWDEGCPRRRSAKPSPRQRARAGRLRSRCPIRFASGAIAKNSCI
jgi:sugar/nucleoside kinase (ribokinase family)